MSANSGEYMAEDQTVYKTNQYKVGWLLCLVMVFALGFTLVTFGAGTPKPKQAGQLWVVDANGKKVGRVISVDSAGGSALVAFKFGERPFLLVVSRTQVETPVKPIFFTSEDCSGQAYLNSPGGTHSALDTMGLLVGLTSNNGTVWAVDPHVTLVQTITPKSYGFSNPGWQCRTDISGTVDALPATPLFDFYVEFLPPFEIR
jgi:hypothetical protein